LSIRLTARGSLVIGGLAAPSIPPGPESSSSDLIQFLRERIRDRESPGATVHTLYMPDQLGYYNVIVGVLRSSPEEVPFGDVFAFVPPATYAVVTPEMNLPEQVDDVWAQLDDAMRDGTVVRAGGSEFETMSPEGRVELNVAVVLT
jgi:hypothetical protein